MVSTEHHFGKVRKCWTWVLVMAAQGLEHTGQAPNMFSWMLRVTHSGQPHSVEILPPSQVEPAECQTVAQRCDVGRCLCFFPGSVLLPLTLQSELGLPFPGDWAEARPRCMVGWLHTVLSSWVWL